MIKDHLLTRAMAAYFRSGGTDQPSATGSGHVRIKGKDYVVLRNIRGVLAVYRVRAYDGVLRRMKRPPAELSDDE